jgi:competence protein ComEC
MESSLSDTEIRSGGILQSPRSPLLWLLLPTLSGLALARFFPSWGTPYALLLGTMGVSVLLWEQFQKNRHRCWFVVALPISVLVLASAWGHLRLPLPDTPPAGYRPPREATLEIEVLRPFQTSVFPDYARGLGRIIETDPFTDRVRYREVQYSVALADSTASWHQPGARFTAKGVLEQMTPEATLDDPWTRELINDGIHFRFRQASLRSFVPTQDGNLQATWRAFQNRLQETLTRSPPHLEAEAGIVAAMLLGQRSLLASEDRDTFLHSGTMHLFAVSGLHVMAVAGALYLLGQVLRMPRRFCALFTVVLLAVYVAAIDFPPSAIRAFLMVTFYTLGRTFQRNTSAFPAVTASAVVILLLDPGQLQDLGFQLSYLVVTSILLWGLPLAEALDRALRPAHLPLSEEEVKRRQRLAKFRRRLLQAFAVSLSATCASAPLIVTHFGLVSPGAIFLNLALVPAAGVIVVNSLLVIGLGFVGLTAMSQFQAHAGWLIASIMRLVVESGLQIPGAALSVQWRTPVLGPVVAIGFLALLGILHTRRQPGTVLGKWALAAPLIYTALCLGLGLSLR